MRIDQRVQVWCLWCGPVFAVLFGIGVVVLTGFLPPPDPDDSAAEIQALYESDLDMIRAGTVVMMLGVPFLPPWACAIAAQSYRIEKGFPILTILQLIAIAIVTLIIMAFALIWAVAAFRAGDISAETTQTLNDIGFFLFLFDWSPLGLWVAALALVIFLDRSERPIYPRWAAYLNLWVALGSFPGGLIVFFKEGPLAFNGVIAFYVPVVVFFIWLVAMTALTLRAIKQQGEQAPSRAPIPATADVS